MTTNKSLICVIAGSVLLFALLWQFTATRVAPSGDAASAWATREPHRTVLCVQQGPVLHLAAAPTEAEQQAVQARLAHTELGSGTPRFGAVFRDHTYRASIRLFGSELAWMKNEYTAGFPELLPNLAFRLSGSLEAGRTTTALLGAFVLALICFAAHRLGGWPAAAVAGVFLATDPAFHLWKKILAGPEVWLQLCAAGLAACITLALQNQTRGPLIAAAFLAGLGLHVKPSFLGVLAVGVVAGLPLMPFRHHSPGRSLRTAAMLALAAILGAGPGLLYLSARPDLAAGGQSIGAQESAGGRAQEALKRVQKMVIGGEPARPAAGSSKKGTGPKKGGHLVDVLVDPTAPFTNYWTIRNLRDNHPASPPEHPETGPSALRTVSGIAAVGLVLLMLLGTWTTESAQRWCIALALLSPFALRLIHPDTHHLGLWLPLLALGIGVGAAAAAAAKPQLRLVVALLIGITAIGRMHGLAAVDEELEARAGRTLDDANLRAIADRLETEGVESLAVLEYEMMSLIEAYTNGRIRPFLYARAGSGNRPGCLVPKSPSWLATILRAHTGGHLLMAWGPKSSPPAGGRHSFVHPVELATVAEDSGLRLRSRGEIRDSRGRWTASLYRIDSK